jgi:hypothetical protein
LKQYEIVDAVGENNCYPQKQKTHRSILCGKKNLGPFYIKTTGTYASSCHYTSSPNKVRELATVYLPLQQWTETSVWYGQTFNQIYYLEVLKRLRGKV